MNVFLFILNAVGFGVGLAMDAFSVSLANGLNEPEMKKNRMALIAGTFSFYQIAMPLLGWLLVRKAAEAFEGFRSFVPWIALILLLLIGGKMLIEGIRDRGETEERPAVGFAGLMMQGIATSIDALSVGFTITEYSAIEAITEALIIGAVTFTICIAGLVLGKRFGTKLAGKASILGGGILVLIGIEIFIKGMINP